MHACIRCTICEFARMREKAVEMLLALTISLSMEPWYNVTRRKGMRKKYDILPKELSLARERIVVNKELFLKSLSVCFPCISIEPSWKQDVYISPCL